MGVNERAVSAGRSLTYGSLRQLSALADQIGPDATIRDVLNKAPDQALSILERDGVITDRERPQFVDPQTGGLSDEGKRFMERAVLGSVVDDTALLEVTPPSILNKVGASVAELAKLMGRGDRWDITPIVREAMLPVSLDGGAWSRSGNIPEPAGNAWRGAESVGRRNDEAAGGASESSEGNTAAVCSGRGSRCSGTGEHVREAGGLEDF